MAASCASCPSFLAPREVPEGVDVRDDYAGVFRDGFCKRFPTAVKVLPDYLCGEHPDLVAARPDVREIAAIGATLNSLERTLQSLADSLVKIANPQIDVSGKPLRKGKP